MHRWGRGRKFGPDWLRIAQHIPGRSDAQCKNRFVLLTRVHRRSVSQYGAETRPRSGTGLRARSGTGVRPHSVSRSRHVSRSLHNLAPSHDSPRTPQGSRSRMGSARGGLGPPMPPTGVHGPLVV